LPYAIAPNRKHWHASAMRSSKRSMIIWFARVTPLATLARAARVISTAQVGDDRAHRELN